MRQWKGGRGRGCEDANVRKEEHKPQRSPSSTGEPGTTLFFSRSLEADSTKNGYKNGVYSEKIEGRDHSRGLFRCHLAVANLCIHSVGINFQGTRPDKSRIDRRPVARLLRG